jgi:hypothetical protein
MSDTNVNFRGSELHVPPEARNAQIEVGLGRRLLNSKRLMARLAGTHAFEQSSFFALQVEPVVVYLGQDAIQRQFGLEKIKDTKNIDLGMRRDLAARMLGQLQVAGIIEEKQASAEVTAPVRKNLPIKMKHRIFTGSRLSHIRMSPAVLTPEPGSFADELLQITRRLGRYADEGTSYEIPSARIAMHMGVASADSAQPLAEAMPKLVGNKLGRTMQFGPIEPVELVVAVAPH